VRFLHFWNSLYQAMPTPEAINYIDKIPGMSDARIMAYFPTTWAEH
jgi:hypothetical protein